MCKTFASACVCEPMEPRRLFAAGDLDITFGAFGVQTHSFGTGQSALDSIVQPDGKIVVVGVSLPAGSTTTDGFVARYNADGSPDTSFGGGDGVNVYGFGATVNDFYSCVALQADGKIVVAGHSEDGAGLSTGPFAIARFNSDGTPDNAFGFSGRTSIDFSGGVDAATGIAVLGDGKILIVGTTASPAGVGIAMTRLEPNIGSIDITFEEPGLPKGRVTDVPSPLSGIGYAAGRMVVDADGKIVVAVTQFSASISGGGISILGADMGVARYSSNGQPDTGFSGDGKVFVGFGATRIFEFGTGVALDPRTGKIVLGGTSANGIASFGATLPGGVGFVRTATKADYGVARFTKSGVPDATFSGDGLRRVDFGVDLLDGCTDVAVDSQGRVTATGGSQIRRQAANFSVARLSPGGALDTAFNGDGLNIFDLGGGEGAFGVTLQTNDNALLFGVKFINATRSRLAVLRLLDE